MTRSTQMLFCTCEDDTEAAALARVLVEQKLAACVNIVPKVRSIYQWQGKIEDDSEVLLIIKTATDKVASLKQAVVEHHSYDSPELISFNIEDGLPEYLQWIGEQTHD